MFHIIKCLFLYLFLVLTFYHSEPAYTQSESSFWQNSSNEFGRQMALCGKFDNISACLKPAQSITRQEISDAAGCIVHENTGIEYIIDSAMRTDFDFDESQKYEEFASIMDDYTSCLPKRMTTFRMPIGNNNRVMSKINECTLEYVNRSKEVFGCTALERTSREEMIFKDSSKMVMGRAARLTAVQDGGMRTATQGGAPTYLRGEAKREWDSVSAQAKSFVCESWDVLSLCIAKRDEALQLTALTLDDEFNIAVNTMRNIAVNTMRCITDTMYIVNDSLTYSKNYRFLDLGFDKWNELVMDFTNCKNITRVVLEPAGASATSRGMIFNLWQIISLSDSHSPLPATVSALREIDRCIDDYINKSRQTMDCSSSIVGE